jgi:hypothetical protein
MTAHSLFPRPKENCLECILTGCAAIKIYQPLDPLTQPMNPGSKLNIQRNYDQDLIFVKSFLLQCG